MLRFWASAMGQEHTHPSDGSSATGSSLLAGQEPHRQKAYFAARRLLKQRNSHLVALTIPSQPFIKVFVLKATLEC